MNGDKNTGQLYHESKVSNRGSENKANNDVTQKEEKQHKTSPVRRLWHLLKADRGDVGSIVVFSILNGALALATPLAVQALVNNVAFGATAPSIIILSGLLFSGLVLGAAVLATQTWIVEIIQRRIFVRLVADLSERLRRLSWEVRDRYYNPELVNRFFDVVTIQKASSELLLAGLGNVLSIVVGFIVIALYHPLLLLLDIGLLLLVLAVFFGPLAAGMRTSIKESQAKYAVAAWLEELARHPLAFRTPGSANFVRLRSRELASDYIDLRKRHYRIVFGQIVAALGVQVVASTAVLGLGGWLVVSGELTIGQLVAAELIVVVVVQSVAKMGKLAETWYDLIAAVDKVGKLTTLDMEAEVNKPAIATKEEAAGLNVRSVPIKPTHFVDPIAVSFELAPGKSLAIMGPHGVGKTFLLETMFGLRKPLAGSIIYDGVHLADIPLGKFRQEVALASEPGLLEATILDNLILGRGEIPIEEIHETLKAVGLLEQILELPDGLATKLLPSGAPLSSGQAGRIAIARVLLSRPRLLMIDHLLDNLSPQGLDEVMDTLEANLKRCSLIIVTNSKSLASRCDSRLLLPATQETSK